MNSVDILGTRVSSVSVPQLLCLVNRWREENRRRTILYANAHCLNLAWDDPTYQGALNQADLVCADGVGVVWAGRLLGGPPLYKASGTEWIQPFGQLAEVEGLRVYILAGRPGVASRAAEVLLALWPGLQITGATDGFFQSQSEKDTLTAINAARPDILFIGRGSPLQELWITRRRDAIDVPVCWTVGSLFDLLAGIEPWPPEWVKSLALQWFWRLLMDPAGKWRRYLVGNPIFVARVLRQKFQPAFRPAKANPGASPQAGPNPERPDRV